MPFGLCNIPATFQRLMQNCLCELNLTYCLIYLDDMIIFSKMEEEHLHHLHVVFEHFREHNLKFKPTKCEFFKNKINYLAHHIYKEGIWPIKGNLTAVVELAPQWPYTKIQAFQGLVGHYQQFIKGFACIAQQLYKHLSGGGTSKKSECVTITEDALGAFEMLTKAYLKAPMLSFANFNKLFLLDTDVSKQRLGAVLSQKQTDCQYHLVAYMSWSLTVHECNYHSTKQEFLALKWVITAFSGMPILEAVCCQDWQQPTHLYHNHTQFRYYSTLVCGITHRIHLWHQIPKGVAQCSSRCPEPSYIEAGCRDCEVHLGQTHCRINRKRECPGPSGSWDWWGNT